MASFVEKVSGANAKALQLVTGNSPGGQPIFVYVVIPLKERGALDEKLASQGADLSKEGTVLFTGWGTPTESDKTRALAEFKKMSA